jgi:hypothetical protein
VPSKLLGRSKLVDCLLVEGNSINWLPWLNEGKKEAAASTIIWMVSSSFIGNDKTGPMSSGRRKLMSQRGYSSKFWHLCAEEYGAALHQDRLAVIYYRSTCEQISGPVKPTPMNLPARAMNNLLLPVGIPQKAWYHGEEREGTMEEILRESPCLVKKLINSTPIHEHVGPMPDRPNTWIRSERGVRRLQTSELAKAKGLPSEWTKKNVSKLEKSWVQHSTCLHVWTAVMDSVSTWLHKTAAEEGECNNEPFTSPKENEEMKLQQSNTSGIQADWSWETPDLSKDGDSYKERVRSLKATVADLPKVPNLYEEV